MNLIHPPIFALVDKEAARKQWNDRFNNRQPGAERKPGKINVRAAATADTTEILLYDEIGYWGVTAKEFNAELAKITTASVLVRINSPGGDVFDGLAMYDALQAHTAAVTCRVDSLAASAGSIVALAGKQVVMAENALMMCHKAWSFSIGNSADMMETASVLEKIDGRLASIYAKKTGKPVADCAAMMAGEGKADGTWFTAEEAKAFGLVDEVDGSTDDQADDAATANAVRLHVAAMKRRLAIAERE